MRECLHWRCTFKTKIFPCHQRCWILSRGASTSGDTENVAWHQATFPKRAEVPRVHAASFCSSVSTINPRRQWFRCSWSNGSSGLKGELGQVHGDLILITDPRRTPEISCKPTRVPFSTLIYFCQNNGRRGTGSVPEAQELGIDAEDHHSHGDGDESHPRVGNKNEEALGLDHILVGMRLGRTYEVPDLARGMSFFVFVFFVSPSPQRRKTRSRLFFTEQCVKNL